ncbi:peptidoglycan DD-metalloendopeptidase family protein [Paenibacillus massiliensis]|uniref:peptidoglycan DD-metalloendopeptidase family protein n=1 Tax=Paenibacillus massiliensis TaxID=225917 RepID=UPI00036B86D4|nr:peptidoglycan DD-metalloendopeptidase family protein [Paenibacillus massiliensis]
MAQVSDLNYPSERLLQGIRDRINAFGNSPKVYIELDKMTYVDGFRRKYDAVKYVAESVTGDLLSIDKAQKLTEYQGGELIEIPTELRNANMSMPILSSSTMHGKENGKRTIQGMYITDWFETDPRCSRKRHKGIDLDLAIGDGVHAVWSGTVRVASYLKGYGNVVYLDHGNGWQTRYAHLSKIQVNVGDTVSVGKQVGLGGNSGRSISSGGGDGSHLHFEVRKDDVALNPEPFLRGTKTIQTPTKTSTSSSPGSSSDVEMNIEATAYVATCPGCIGITRGGTDVRTWKDWKIIAVDPSVIPLKSRVELIVDGVSWGEYLADDTGGDIKGNRLDILMETKAKALNFGRKNVLVRVKSWGDGKERTSAGGGGTTYEITPAKEIVTYQVNKTIAQQSFYKDFSKRSALDKLKFPVQDGSEQFFVKDGDNQINVLGFKGTSGAGSEKKLVFEHTWTNNGNLGWAYYADFELDDVVTVKVDNYLLVTLKGNSAKHGIAYPASIPVPKGKHKIEFSFANSTKASVGQFGLLDLRAKEFTVSTVEQKQVWEFEDPMNSVNNWTPYGTVSQADGGSFQAISTKGSEAGIQRLDQIKKFPFTINFRVKMTPDSQGKLVVGDGKKAFVLNLTHDTVYSQGGGQYSTNNTDDFVEYTMVCHDDTDMDLYVKRIGADEAGTWVNTGIRGAAIQYPYQSRILFSVTKGQMKLDSVKYAASDYAIEQLATHIAENYSELWYEVGDFVFEETFTIESDIMEWEVNTHMDMASATARVTLNNSSGLYSPTWERSPEFPEAYRSPDSAMSYYEEGEVRHVVSEGTPIRIYAGYGEEVVRVFTGMIQGEIQEDSKKKTISFSCVDMYDLLEEFVFYKPMNYPPDEAYAGDGGAYAWIKSSIVEDIVVAAGLANWRFHAEDLKHADYEIEDTVYIDVNKGENTFMKFNRETGELEAVNQQDIMKVGGWENPFVASVTFPIGTRATDAIQSLIQDIPYHTRCDRYGTFLMHRMDFLDYPDWQVQDGARWEFIDGENLISLASSTDYSGVRNHLMISGSAGNVEHFFDKSLIVATKGNIRTAGIQADYIDEQDGAAMRGAKELVASKVFFDIKRQARTKNVVVKGNPLIELLDAVYVYDANTYTANYFIVKGNRMVGNGQGIQNYLELTWQTLTKS